MISTSAPDTPLQSLSRSTEKPEPASSPDAFQSGPPASEPDDSAVKQPAPADDVDTATAPLE